MSINEIRKPLSLGEEVTANIRSLLARIKPSPPKPKPTPDLVYQRALTQACSSDRLMIRLMFRPKPASGVSAEAGLRCFGRSRPPVFRPKPASGVSAEAGLRRGEVCQIHERDLVEDLAGLSLIVRGKGGRSRIVPLTKSLEIALREHISQVGGGFAFPGRIEGHLSAAYVGKRISNLLPEGISMHSLRHRFATRVYRATSDLLATQRLLGHASPATTQIYVAIDEARLRKAVEAA